MNQRFSALMAKLAVISVLVGGPSLALGSEESWYQVEYILFHHRTPDLSTLAYEDKPDRSQKAASEPRFRFYKESNFSAPVHDVEQQLENENTDTNTDMVPEVETSPISENSISEFHLYPSTLNSEIQLEDAYKKLKRDPRTIVYHFRHWQQSFASDIDALPIKIYDQLGPNTVLEGQLLIEKERYLHAKIDVSLKERYAVKKVDWASEALKAIPPYAFFDLDLWQPPGLFHILYPEDFEIKQNHQESPVSQSISLYDFSESSSFNSISSELIPIDENYEWIDVSAIDFVASRRIKDQELHYIDHPYFGLIATIKRIDNPYELDFEAATDDDLDSSTVLSSGS